MAAAGTGVVVVIRALMAGLLVGSAAGGGGISDAAASRLAEPNGSLAAPSSNSGNAPSQTEVTVPCGASVCPSGVGGAWTVAFDDEFDASALDTSKWSTMDGQVMNGVTALASNATVDGGNLVLRLSDATHGAYVSSAPFDRADSGGYLFPVGSYTEARIWFPGDGTTLYNWVAWWTGSGPAWPAGGEFDIAEGMGTLTSVCHGDTGEISRATPPGAWSNGFHTYGLYRGAHQADYYWDGKKVASCPTTDNGAGHGLLLTVGNDKRFGPVEMTGPASDVKVDYVRAWTATS